MGRVNLLHERNHAKMRDFDTNGTPEALDERNPYSWTRRSHWEGSRTLKKAQDPRTFLKNIQTNPTMTYNMHPFQTKCIKLILLDVTITLETHTSDPTAQANPNPWTNKSKFQGDAHVCWNYVFGCLACLQMANCPETRASCRFIWARWHSTINIAMQYKEDDSNAFFMRGY